MDWPPQNLHTTERVWGYLDGGIKEAGDAEPASKTNLWRCVSEELKGSLLKTIEAGVEMQSVCTP